MDAPDAGPQAERSRRLAAQTARAFPPAIHALPIAVSAGPGAAREDPHGRSTPTSTTTADAPATRLQALSAVALPPAQCVPTALCHVELAQLREEKAFLTKYAERLLVQLRLVLHKHGELDKLKAITDPAAIVGDADAEREVDVAEKRLPPWMVAREVVHPLLQAYDIKIYELETTVSESKQAMDRMARHAESLAQSNTTLRQELEAVSEKMVLRMQHEPKETSALGLNGDDFLNESGGEYLGDLNERIDVLMSENSMLMEQVSLQDDELNGLKKELGDRDQQIALMGQNFNQATLALQELRDACTAVNDEKNRCEQQLQQYAARMAQLENEKEAALKRVEDLKSDEKSLESQLLDYENLLENVKSNAERKDESFASRYQNVCARLRELNAAIEDRDKRIEVLEDQVRTTTSELDCVRQDCEGMLQVMNSMEKQLTQYCAREDAVSELELQCKVKIEEMTIEKEQISAREGQARREIARLLERIRSVTEEQMKAHEETLSQLSRRHEQELKSREAELRDVSGELAQLRVKVDASARNQREVEKNLVDAARRVKDSSDMYERKLKGLVERAAAAEEAKDMASRIENEAMLSLRAKEEELAKLRNDFRERTQDLNDRITSLERELEVRRGEARELREENEEKNRKTQLLNEQLNKVKADCANRFSSDFEAVHKENRELKARAAELEYRLTTSKADLSKAVEAAKGDRERSEVRLIAEVETLKARLSSLKEEKARVERARQEAESRHGVMGLQIQQLTRELADTREALIEREHACDDSDRKVSELSAQLTIALSKQQQFFRQERELRATIERCTLEKTRLERDATICKKKLEEYRQADFLGMTQYHGRTDGKSYVKPDKRAHQQSNQSARVDEVLS